MSILDNSTECHANVAGGCGACELCDPEYWEALRLAQLPEPKFTPELIAAILDSE